VDGRTLKPALLGQLGGADLVISSTNLFYKNSENDSAVCTSNKHNMLITHGCHWLIRVLNILADKQACLQTDTAFTTVFLASYKFTVRDA